MSREKGSEPRSILIVKLSAIGDVVQSLPMLEALRRKYQKARIDWLVEEEASDILIGHPALNQVIISRRKSWLNRFGERGAFRTLAEIKNFVRELRSRHYDWVIDNHGVLKSGLLTFLARGRRKIGFKASAGIADEGSYLFTNERYKPLSIERHALERYLDLVSQMGVETGKPFLEFRIPEEAERRAENLLRQNGSLGRPIVVIHPMAKWVTKQWPIGNFARVISCLLERRASVVITGGGRDDEAIREILDRVPERARVLNLVGRTNLKELGGIFAFSDLVLTPDTGPMHLAAAVQAPLIALFGPTAPWRTGPYGDQNAVVRKPLPCSPCFRKKCESMECMKSITVEDVLREIEEKLKHNRADKNYFY